MARLENIYKTGTLVITLLLSAQSFISAKTTVRLVTWDTGEGLKLTQDACNAFQKLNPGTDIKVESWGWDGYREKLLVSLGAGKAPDVFLFNEAFSSTFLYTGLIMPLTDFIKQDKMSTSGLIKSLQQIYQYRGELFGLPKDFAPYAVYYNKTLFDQAGIKYPEQGWSWNDLTVIAKKLTKTGTSGKITQGGFNFYPGKEETHVFLSTMGTSFMSPEEERFKGFLDSPDTLKTVQFMADYKLKDKVVGSVGDFAGGKIGLSLQGPWDMATWVKKKNLKYGIVAPPVGKQKGGCIASAAWSISTGTKHKKEAWNLVKFLGGPEGNKIMGKSLWAVPSWNQTIKELKITQNPDLNQLLEASESAISSSPVNHPFYDLVVPKYIYPAIQSQVWEGKKSAVQALTAITATCDNEYQKYLKTIKRVVTKRK